MLDKIRKRSDSFVVWILFGIIIAVFVINFGPQQAGCGAPTTTHAARVAGSSISVNDLQTALSMAGLRGEQIPAEQTQQLRGMVMDQLIVRELLAVEAKKLGLEVSSEEIDEMLVKGQYYAFGQPRSLNSDDAQGFDYDKFSQYVRYYWGTSVPKFKEFQARELLAEKMRQYLKASVKLSEDEVKATYQHENRQVTLSYVRFTPAEFRGQVDLSLKTVQSFVDKNPDKIKQYYEANKSSYTGLGPQVNLQVMFISSDKIGPAKARAEAGRLLTAIQQGGDFSALAASSSNHGESKLSGGWLGWRNDDALGLPAKLVTAIAKVKDNQLSELVEEKEGVYFVKVLGRRKGDVTLEQAKLDVARTLMADLMSEKLAGDAAAMFIKRAKAGEKLADMFTPEATSEDTTGQNPAGVPTDPAQALQAQAKAALAAIENINRSPLTLQKSAPFPRSSQDMVPGIGISKEIMKEAFSLKKGDVAAKPFKVGDAIYLIAVEDRTEPDMTAWERRKTELTNEQVTQKWAKLVQDYAKERCNEAYNDKKIKVKAEVVMGAAKPGSPAPDYTPCKSLAM